MKDKRGFTIVELAVVVTLIMLLTAIVAARISSVNDKSKERIYDAKIEIIKDGAIKYGTDNIDLLKPIGNSCAKEITVNTLIQMNYLKADDGYDYQLINPLTN